VGQPTIDPAIPDAASPAPPALWLRRIGLIAGILGFVAFEIAGPAGGFLRSAAVTPPGPDALPSAAWHAAAVASLMAAWWLTEAISIYWTSLVPLVLYPLLLVFPGGHGANLRAAARPYVDEYIFLFLGGMCIAGAMEQWNLHRRIALHILRRVGAEGDRILLGFLVATAFISLWISNTATAVMMLPIGMAVIRQLEGARGVRLAGLGAAIMLAIAYGANIGGIGTKIGTAPNAICCGFVEAKLHRSISFLDWVAIAFPFVVVFVPFTWCVLRFVARKDLLGVGQGREAVEREIAALGRMKPKEWTVAAVFLAAALLWIFGQPLARALGLAGKTYEATVALLAALFLFASGTFDAVAARRVPWVTLLLLGGGFSMAAGVEASGLSKAMGQSLSGVAELHGFLQFLVVSVLTVAVSAVASNVATINIMLPILASVFPGSVPILAAATMASSCDFMLPAGTPPNAIVFGSGYLTVPRMARVGFVLDLAAAVLVAVWSWLGVTWWLD